MIPLLCITAYSGTGKTTLLKQLIPILSARGIRSGVIKHSHHDMDIDIPGKDSYILRKAGANQTIVASDKRWALITETPEEKTLSLDYLISRMNTAELDIVLAEGFRHEKQPSIALYREATGHSVTDLMISDHVIAIASDCPLPSPLPQLSINQPEDIALFIEKWLEQNRRG